MGAAIASLFWYRRSLATAHLLKKHQEILNEIEDGYYEVNLSGKTIFVNNGIKKVFGYTREEILAMDNRDYMTPENAARIYKAFNDVYTSGLPAKSFSYEVIHKDGNPRFLETSITLMKNHNGVPTGFRGITRDVTQRKLSEEALRKAKDDAEAASQAKSIFLANMSHEIRTPMNGVIGMTRLLLDTELTEDQARYLRLISNCGDNLLEIINDILDFSKIEAKQLIISSEEFDPQILIREIIDSLMIKSREKNLDLSFEKSGEIPGMLVGDPVRIRQILVNLAGNAVKFTESGQVTIKLRCKEKSDGKAFLEFSVKDTGIGIPKENTENLFKAFTQIDGSISRKYGGTGLGLAISSELAALMNGSITFQSEPGMGSEFTFHVPLPFIEKPDKNLEENGAKHDESALKPDVDIYKKRISELAKKIEKQAFDVLLAEDHPVNRELCEKMLAKIGISVVIAKNGREAINEIEEKVFDLIIMDVQMPHLSGIEATKIIREPATKTGNEKTPIIAITAHAMTGDRERCLKAGMDYYISKPIAPDLLYSSVLKALEAKHGTSS